MFKSLFVIMSIGVFVTGCGEDLVGEVGGRDITRAEFNRYLKYKNIPQKDEKRVASVLKDFLLREGYATSIENSSDFDELSIEMEIKEFRKQIVISRYFEAFLNDKVNEEAIRNFYNTNTDEFEKEKIKVAHVLVRTRDKMSDTERQAALTKAQEAYSKARAGALFSDIAKQYSEDTMSAKNGGELGWLNKGAIDPTFTAKVFELKVGEISEPFKTPFGFHVVKILEEPKVIKAPFEKVKGDIRYRLRQQVKQAEKGRLIKEAEIKYL